MDISTNEAKTALDDVARIQHATRKALSDGPAGAILILWGCIWAVGYLGTHFLHEKCGWLWFALDLIGIAGTFITFSLLKPRTRSAYDKPIWFFWLLLFVYGFIWLFLLVPTRWDQLGAFLPTLIMFAYVVLGLFFWRYLLWIGLATTALTLVGYFLLPAYFCIWMAFVGGGSLILPGVLLRTRRT